MAGQYSHKHFFRNMPNERLVKYFAFKNIVLDIDFDKLEEKDAELIFNAFIGLPEEQQATIEKDFRHPQKTIPKKRLENSVVRLSK